VTTIYTSSSIPRYHVLFIIAAGGKLGCATTIDDGSGTQFVALYNFDAATAKQILCNVVLFFYHHGVVVQHLVSDMLISLISKKNVHNAT
jgi:hypothetical protein